MRQPSIQTSLKHRFKWLSMLQLRGIACIALMITVGGCSQTESNSSGPEQRTTAIQPKEVDDRANPSPSRPIPTALNPRSNSKHPIAQKPLPQKPLLLNNWIYCWGEVPTKYLDQDVTRGAHASNLAPTDYTGPQKCKECHAQNFARWEAHPHAKMNAEANETTILGRFDGETLELHGGKITVLQRDGEYFIQLRKDQLFREFRITKTIGSRQQQFYLGVLHKGPPISSLTADEQQSELVMPLGFGWLKNHGSLRTTCSVALIMKNRNSRQGTTCSITFQPSNTMPNVPSAIRRCPRGIECSSITLPAADRKTKSILPCGGSWKKPCQVWPIPIPTLH